MTFRFFNEETGGTPLFEESKEVTVDAGVFRTNIGDTNSIPAGLAGQEQFLEIEISGDSSPLNPRQRVRIPGTPAQLILESLQVSGYIQLALSPGFPPPEDCDEESEKGRMAIDYALNRMYVCFALGWSALTPGGDGGVAGYEVNVVKVSPQPNFAPLEVKCSVGKKVIGGGAKAIGLGVNDRGTWIDTSVPNEERDGWIGAGHSPGTGDGPYGLHVYAICAE